MRAIDANNIALKVLLNKTATLAEIEALAQWVSKIAPGLDEFYRNAENAAYAVDSPCLLPKEEDVRFLLRVLDKQERYV